MQITVKDVLRVASKEFGKSCTSERARRELLDYIQEAVQIYLSDEGYYGHKRWCVCSSGACFTLPTDAANVIKYKVDGKVEKAWNKYYTFHGDAPSSCEGYREGLVHIGDNFPTVYDLPPEGARIAVIATGPECEGAQITIQGEDDKGNQIIVAHFGEEMNGERLDIKYNKPTYTKSVFKKITAVEKSDTQNPVSLYWIKVNNGQITEQGILSTYGQNENFGCYSKYRMMGVNENCCHQISIIGNLKSPRLKYDNDILPIKDITILKAILRSIKASETDDYERARFNMSYAEKRMEREKKYRDKERARLDVCYNTSPKSLRNIQ